MRQEGRGSKTKHKKRGGCICTQVVFLPLLNHQAGGTLHTQLHQHCGVVSSVRLSRPAILIHVDKIAEKGEKYSWEFSRRIKRSKKFTQK
jgi:hypothetical protein